MSRTLTPTFKRDRVSRRADRPGVSDPDDATAIRESSSARRVDATTPRRVPLPRTPASGAEPAVAHRARVPPRGPAKTPGVAAPREETVPSERWVTRFMAFKCVHLDPMADERAAQLSARVRAQTASIAKVKHHLSTYDSNGASLSAEGRSFKPKPSRTTRRVDNVTAFLAAVAEKKFMLKKARRARRRSRLSTVSDDEEGTKERQTRSLNARKKEKGRPLVSRRDARAPSPSPPVSGDEDEGDERLRRDVYGAPGPDQNVTDAFSEKSNARRSTRLESSVPTTPTRPYAYGASPSVEELDEVVARVRLLNAGGTSTRFNSSFREGINEKNASLEASRSDALAGALEAYHGSLRETNKIT